MKTYLLVEISCLGPYCDDCEHWVGPEGSSEACGIFHESTPVTDDGLNTQRCGSCLAAADEYETMRPSGETIQPAGETIQPVGETTAASSETKGLNGETPAEPKCLAQLRRHAHRRRAELDAEIAAEVLGGNVVKETAARAGLAEITVLDALLAADAEVDPCNTDCRHIDYLRDCLERTQEQLANTKTSAAEMEALLKANEGRVKAIVDESLLRRAERAEAQLAALRQMPPIWSGPVAALRHWNVTGRETTEAQLDHPTALTRKRVLDGLHHEVATLRARNEILLRRLAHKQPGPLPDESWQEELDRALARVAALTRAVKIATVTMASVWPEDFRAVFNDAELHTMLEDTKPATEWEDFAVEVTMRAALFPEEGA